MRLRKITQDDVIIRDIKSHEVDVALNLFEDGMIDYRKYFWNTLYSFSYISFPVTSIAYTVGGLTLYLTASVFYFTVVFLLCFFIRFYQVDLWYNLCIKSELEKSDIMNDFVYKERCCYKVALFNGTVIGTVAVKEDTGGTTGEIMRMYVDDKYQRRGLGRLLMDVARKFCLECGYTEMILITGAGHTKAINFYTKYGFAEVDRFIMPVWHNEPYFTPGTVQIKYAMKLKFNSLG